MEAVYKEFTTNKYGVKIVKCCASCQHCEADKLRDDLRICMGGHGNHANNYLCDDWSMNSKIDELKISGDGRIKKPTYFAWLKDQVDKLNYENLDEKTRKAIIINLPQRYEEILGTRYLDI